ncbi:MAG: ferrous iron transport protein A [Heteroscytonema crispum UTEX LB 1556]
MKSSDIRENSFNLSPHQEWQEFPFFCEPTSKQANQKSISRDELRSAVLPLSYAKVGDRLRIVEMQHIENINHFLEMGFIPGAELQILSQMKSGSAIVALQDKCLELGADTAAHILVKKAEQNQGQN